MSILDDLLAKVKYNPDKFSHLIPDNTMCAKCENRVCEYICPARVYEWDENKQKLQVAFENCLECGACRIACTHDAIDWRYPRAGKGVTFKNS